MKKSVYLHSTIQMTVFNNKIYNYVFRNNRRSGYCSSFRKKDKENLHHYAMFVRKQLKIDQSIAHNGVCLTVVKTNETYTVTAIKETLTAVIWDCSRLATK